MGHRGPTARGDIERSHGAPLTGLNPHPQIRASTRDNSHAPANLSVAERRALSSPSCYALQAGGGTRPLEAPPYSTTQTGLGRVRQPGSATCAPQP